jgi:hypothetical protein
MPHHTGLTLAKGFCAIILHDPDFPEVSWSCPVPLRIPASCRLPQSALFAIMSALALASCGSPASRDIDEKLSRAEAAAQRAEKAQHAAEAAAARIRSNQLAANAEHEDNDDTSGDDDTGPSNSDSNRTTSITAEGSSDSEDPDA